MQEHEKIIMLYTLLHFVEEIHKGKPSPTPWAIRERLHYFEQTIEQLSEQAVNQATQAQKSPPSR